MAYASWSVVFGEQPSAAKWNMLGTNDASFNDGTGIANMATNTTAISNPYKFSVYRSAAYSTVATTRTVMPFDTKRFDTNSNVDIVTNKGRYTAPVAGFYYFTAQIGGAVAGYRITELWVNNVKVRQGDSHYYTTAQTVSTHLSALVQLAAADYVEIKYYTDGSQAVSVTSGDEAYFDGFLVSRT